MKSKITPFVILFVLCLIQARAQDPYEGSVTLFAEEGENFSLFLNGEKVNASPAAKVVAEKVKDASISMRIVFEDGSIQPVKKNVMRAGKDCTYILKKDKKGQYVVRVKSCLNPFPQGPGAGGDEPMSSGGSQPEKLSASYSDGVITVNNGNTYTVTKSRTSGMPSPHVIMNAPVGAKVTITYDNNAEKYETEVPFDYVVDDYNNNNSYFRLTVDEGGPDKTWYVRLQNSNGYKLTIE